MVSAVSNINLAPLTAVNNNSSAGQGAAVNDDEQLYSQDLIKVFTSILEALADDGLTAHEKAEKIQQELAASGYDTNTQDYGVGIIGQAVQDIVTLYKQLSTPNSDIQANKQQMQQVQQEISALLDKIKINIRDRSLAVQANILPEAPPAATPVTTTSNVPPITVDSSYADIWAGLADSIGNIKNDYLDFYAGLLQKYTSMYEKYNDFVQKASSDSLSDGGDANHVKIDKAIMLKGYQDFNNYIKTVDCGSVPNWASLTADQKVNMHGSLEPAFNLSDQGKISINLDQYTKAVGVYPTLQYFQEHNSAYPAGINDDGKVSTPSYQAWLATFNAMGSTLQSNMQSFAQRYSQANSTYDNLNKVLSGAITALAESANQFIKNFV